MPINRPNTVTLHLSAEDPQWQFASSAGWETRFGDGNAGACEDNTRQRNIPQRGELGELPWSPVLVGVEETVPLTDMRGVRFEPLGGLTTPNFMVPYYDWGIRAAYFGHNNPCDATDSPRCLVVGDYFEMLFDSADARQTFLDSFGTTVRITRTGRDLTDPSSPVDINEVAEYSAGNQTDIEDFDPDGIWGSQNLFFVSWRQITSGPGQQGGDVEPSVISNVVDFGGNPDISTIIDIEFIDLPTPSPTVDIMGTCDTQTVNPCSPVAPPECELNADCIGCNSNCIGGICTCEDCPCHSVCYQAPVEEDFSDFIDPTPREGLVADNIDNCVDCVSPLAAVGSAFCDCRIPAPLAKCRPERGTGAFDSCDCAETANGTQCCGPDAEGEYRCCLLGVPNPDFPGSPFQTCLETDEFFDPGDGSDPIRIKECTTIDCFADGDCGNECVECVENQCTPKANETPCGSDDPQCNHCIDGECVSTGITDCNCDGNECPDGFECCPEGHCCDPLLGGCDGDGCSECDDDGDCVALNGPCSECTPDGCTVVDCDPCFELNPVTCNCDPICTGCKSICELDDEDIPTCLDTCEVCEDCTVQIDINGNEVGICSGGPPTCTACETLDTSTTPCQCVGGCGDCQICNDGICETDPAACGCCTECGFVDTGGGQGFWGCGNPSLPCPDDAFGNPQICTADFPTAGNCSCIPTTCSPPCEGCAECVDFGSNVFRCLSPSVVGNPDPCIGICQECTMISDNVGECQGDTCNGGECCFDGSCCLPNEDCCNGGVDDRGLPAIYCCPEGNVCCNNGSCCPNRTFCCNDHCCDLGTECCGDACCDPQSCEVCVDGKCESTLGDCESCINGQPFGACNEAACEECVGDKCVDKCVDIPCFSCDGAGTCISDCDAMACETCNGIECVVDCPPCTSCDGAGTCVGGCPPCETCDGGVCVPVENPCLCEDADPCANCEPDPACTNPCICAGTPPSNDPCSCWIGTPGGSLSALVDCDCSGDSSGGGGTDPVGCCCVGSIGSSQRRSDCIAAGGSWTAGDCPTFNPCDSLGGAGGGGQGVGQVGF